MKSNIYSSYNDFINNAKNKIIVFNAEYHNSIKFASSLYNILSNILINDELVTILNNSNILTVSYADFQLIYTKYKNTIDTKIILDNLKSLLFKSIPYNKNNIEIYNCFLSLDYVTYFHIIDCYCKEFHTPLLYGDKLSIPNIGNLLVVTLKSNNKKRLDFKETKKFKKLYEENNINKDYRVYTNRDSYLYVNFHKSNNVNLRYYSFSPTNYINTVDRNLTNYVESKPTMSDIVCDNKLGIVKKLTAIDTLYSNYNLKYIENGIELSKRQISNC